MGSEVESNLIEKRRTYWVAANAAGIVFLVVFALRFGDFVHHELASPDQLVFSVMPFGFLPVAAIALPINLIALICIARSRRPKAKRNALGILVWLSVAWLTVTALCIAGL